MIPYIHIPDGNDPNALHIGPKWFDFHLGPLHIQPLPIHPFGILVATGVLLGTYMTSRRARALGWDVAKLNSFVTWMLVSAFVLSHVLDSLFYHWDEVVKRPQSIFMLWEGLSSFGGFIGAVVGIVLWRYLVIDDGRLRVRPKPHALLPFADLVLSCLPLGWMFGRAGCASVHDHPGARTTADALLAVSYPTRPGDGDITHFGFIEFIHGHDPRFDLGLLELMFTIVLTACFALTWRRRVPLGSYAVATALSYAPVRFVMDYLRIPESEGGDTRYAGLTPAQHCCIALFLFGIVMIFYMRRLQAKGIDPTVEVMAPPPEEPTGIAAPAASG